TLLPAPSTSMGKLQLAFLDSGKLRESVTEAALLAGRGPNAIRTMTDLEQQLAENREVGWAFQDEELEYGLRSLAVPVFTTAPDHPIAAINVAVQASRWPLEKFVHELLAPVIDAGEQLSR